MNIVGVFVTLTTPKMTKISRHVAAESVCEHTSLRWDIEHLIRQYIFHLQLTLSHENIIILMHPTDKMIIPH